MKKLSKVLSLVLVIAMVFSLCVIGASANSFKDTDKINDNYKEAVDVMSGIGIIDGLSETTFGPTANFTRAQAAKIITYMQLGVDGAKALTAKSTFADSANHWATTFIAYCAQQGIVNGYNAKTFGPDDALTGYQWTKMLLCAVGYGVNKEYVGANWALNAARDGMKYGVYNSWSSVLAGSTGSVVTREVATAMAFNTLVGMPKVTYSALLGDYINNTQLGGIGTGVTTNGTLGKTVYSLTNTIARTAAGAPIYSPVVFNTAAKGYVMADASNATEIVALGTLAGYKDAGRSGYVWYIDGAKNTLASNIYYTDTVVATKTDGKGTATWCDPTKTDYVGAEAETVTQYYNGAETPVASAAPVAGDSATLVDTNSNGEVDTMITVHETAAVAAAAPVVTKTGAVEYVTIAGVLGKTSTATVVYDNTIVKGDVVLTTVANGITYLTKAEAFKDTVKSTNPITGTAVIGADTYSVAAASCAVTNFDINDVTAFGGKEATFYKNSAGYLVYVDGSTPVTLDNIVYVAQTGEAADVFGNTSAYASLVKMDGTIIPQAVVAKIGDTAVTGKDKIKDKFYTYTTNAAGAYVLTAMGTDYAQNEFVTDLTKGTSNTAFDTGDTVYGMKMAANAQFLTQYTATVTGTTVTYAAADNNDGALGTSATNFLAYNAATKTYSQTTGVANAPVVNPNQVNTFYVLSKSGFAVAAVSATGTAVSTASDYVYVINATCGVNFGTPNTYSYAAIINGTYDATVPFVSSANDMAVGLYKVTAKNAAGVATVWETMGTGAAGAVAVTGNTLTYGSSKSAVVNDNTVVWVMDATAGVATTATQMTTADIATINTQYVGKTFTTITLPVSATDATVSAIFLYIS